MRLVCKFVADGLDCVGVDLASSPGCRDRRRWSSSFPSCNNLVVAYVRSDLGGLIDF